MAVTKMDLSPSKQSTAKRLSLLYLVFLAGVAFLSVDIWSRQLASSVQVPVLRLQQRKCDTQWDRAAEQNGSVMLYVVTPTYTRYTAPDILTSCSHCTCGGWSRRPS